MNDYQNKAPKPVFPERAVITAGMPYGNKLLHFGHIGAVFVPADFYARFLRDRIGKDNVIFVSGTDCYGSPIEEGYRSAYEKGLFDGTIEDYVRRNHEAQHRTVDAYRISCNLFGASGLEPARDIHAELTDWIIRRLYENGQLVKRSTKQFYDTEAGKFLNGRQVIGKCPVENCQSDKAYADECDKGHQYMPENLIDPKSVLTGQTPEMRDVVNWYFNLIDFCDLLAEYTEGLKGKPTTRRVVYNTLKEFLEPPVIYIKKELYDSYLALAPRFAEHELRDLDNPKKTSFAITFSRLPDCDAACTILTENGLRFRTGKTLVPFRLTGNIKWGVPAPELEDTKDLTVWVWPESLWAPISFTKTYLQSIGKSDDEWKRWWCSPDSKIYQFIGSDNIYFYGIAQQALFAATQTGKEHFTLPEDGELQTSTLVAVNHILFLDKKASSSGDIKPPMAHELLDYYTVEQLRAHFLSLGLAMKSVSFQPKPLNPNANENEPDPVLKEGNLLTNVLNRLARSCFYTAQKYFDGAYPEGVIDEKILADSKAAIDKYELHMYKLEFHQVMYVLDSFIRDASRYWAKNSATADKADDNELRAAALRNLFHLVRTAATLIHPLAPDGAELLREYLGLGEELWSWDNITKTLPELSGGSVKLKFLEPRFDFFKKHPSQLGSDDND